MNKVMKIAVAAGITVGAWALALLNGKCDDAEMLQDGAEAVEEIAEDVIENGDIA